MAPWGNLAGHNCPITGKELIGVSQVRWLGKQELKAPIQGLLCEAQGINPTYAICNKADRGHNLSMLWWLPATLVHWGSCLNWAVIEQGQFSHWGSCPTGAIVFIGSCLCEKLSSGQLSPGQLSPVQLSVHEGQDSMSIPIKVYKIANKVMVGIFFPVF